MKAYWVGHSSMHGAYKVNIMSLEDSHFKTGSFYFLLFATMTTFNLDTVGCRDVLAIGENIWCTLIFADTECIINR